MMGLSTCLLIAALWQFCWIDACGQLTFYSNLFIRDDSQAPQDSSTAYPVGGLDKNLPLRKTPKLVGLPGAAMGVAAAKSSGLGALGPPGGAIGPSVPKLDDLAGKRLSGMIGGMMNEKSGKSGQGKGEGSQGKTTDTRGKSKGVKGKAKGKKGSGSGKGGMMMMMGKKKTRTPTESPTAFTSTASPSAGGTGAPTANTGTSVPTIAAAPAKAIATDVPTLGFATSAPSSAIVNSRAPHSRATAAPSAKGAKTTLAPTTAGADLRWNLTLDLSKVASQYQGLFYTAARRWEQVNVGDVPDVMPTSQERNQSSCTNLPNTIDDMYICADVTPIDGPSNILGYGQPQLVRQGSLIPFAGYMKFDSADIGGSVISPTILHEMGHAIGVVGGLWVLKKLSNSSTPTCAYAAKSNASLQYQTLSKCSASSSVPIEQMYGAGSECTHWSEACFQGELMTSYIGGGNYLSVVTVGALQDIGYTVDYTKADAYTRADMGSTCLCRRRELVGLESDAISSPGLIKQRKLSDEGMQVAVSFGKAHLEMMKQKKARFHDDGKNTFVGDLFVSVVYRENGHIFVVGVGAD